MADRLHLAPQHRRILEDLLREHLPEVEMWAYGSRVNGRGHEGSDLNLVLRGPGLQELPWERLIEFEAAIRESAIPILVEARDWARLPEKFQREIEREYVVLDAPPSTGWRDVSIGDIADIVGGGTPSTKNARNFGGVVPWLTPRDLSGPHNRYIERGERNLSQQGLDSSSAKLLSAGAVLLSTRAPIGYVALAKNAISTNQGFRNLVVRDGVFPEFLYYWLKLNTSELERHASGSTFRELSGSALKQIRLNLPPLPEQRAIAHVLGALDDKIELNRRMNETLEGMARALFKSWFVDFDPVRAKMEGRDPGLPQDVADLFPNRLVDSEMGEIPEGWEVTPLDVIARFQNGLALQKYRPQEGESRLPVVKIAQLRAGEANSGEWASSAIKPECVIEDGDVLFSWSGSLLVRVWCGGQAALNQHLFKVTSGQYPKWLYLHLLLSHLRRFQRIAQDKATTMGHIRRHHLTEALCAVPPKRVIAALSGTFSGMLTRQVASEMSIRTLVALRDTLLPKLVSGEIQVPDAKALLESAL